MVLTPRVIIPPDGAANAWVLHSGSPMTIRPATPEDVPQVLPMVAAIARLHESWDPAKYGYLPNPEEMYRGWLRSRARDPQSVFLVATVQTCERDVAQPPSAVISIRQESQPRAAVPHEPPDAKLIGFLIGTIEREIPIYRVEQFGFIHDLWVEPDYRHEGVGRQLAMLAVEQFKQLGVPQVRCDTAWANEPARKLFASCGFRPSIVEMLLEFPKNEK
jgi:ribosomal protein S18 acetylase RimI-like enzyme